MATYIVMPGNVDQTEYMTWNTRGNAYMHTVPKYGAYIDKIKLALPILLQPFPFEIGVTGYVEMIKPIPTNTFGKAVDNVGRNVFIIDDIFLFQRYENGNVYMYTHTWIDTQTDRDTYYQPVDENIWKMLISKISINN